MESTLGGPQRSPRARRSDRELLLIAQRPDLHYWVNQSNPEIIARMGVPVPDRRICIEIRRMAALESVGITLGRGGRWTRAWRASVSAGSSAVVEGAKWACVGLMSE